MAKVLFENIVGEEVVCKHFKDFTEVEQRYLETLVEEAIIQKGINVTTHCEKRLKQRKYSMGRLHLAVRQGQIMEIQFDKTGCKVQLSFASGSQLGKGYTSYVVYDLASGNVISAWNRQNKQERKLGSETYIGHKQYLKKQESIMPLINTYLEIPIEDINNLVFKYDKSPLSKKSMKQLNAIVTNLQAQKEMEEMIAC